MLFARTRFLLMGLVLALMSILIVIISGLTAGLVNDGVSGLKAMGEEGAEVVAFEDGTQTDSAFTRSIVPLTAADDLAAADGVAEAAPMGLSIVNARNQDGTPVDLTLIGVEPDSFIAPEGMPEIAERTETELEVTAFADGQRTFGHVDMGYVPLDVWQEAHAGARAGEAAHEHAYGEASVVVAQGTPTGTVDGLDVRTLEESFQSSPGYGPETMTLSMIEWFLYIITALVTGAFFLVWTIQRSGDIAIMRAMGATRGFLLRDSLGQAVVILALSIGVGVALAVGLGLWLESSPMPYVTEFDRIAAGAGMLFISGLIGALVAVFRVTRTDPLTALGENR